VHFGFVFAIILLSSMGIITNNAWADPIAIGVDLFRTDPATTSIDIVPDLPADFFCPGSPPFGGTISLQGVPLPGFGDTDTIVERFGDVFPFPVPGTATFPINLVALSLTSVAPITVTGCDPTPQDWRLDVFSGVLFGLPQPFGEMTVLHVVANGGSFNAELPVQPKLIFTRVDEPAEPIELDLPSDVFLSSGPWAHTGHCNDPHPIELGSGGFFAGFDPLTGNPVLIEEIADLARHGVFPAGGPCAVGGELIPLDTTMVLVAGTHSVAAWMIPVIVSGIGIAIVIARKF